MHILIIGGTGMLTDAVNHFIRKNFIVSLTGRTKSKLNSFAKNNPQFLQNINLIYTDYTDSENFLTEIKSAEEKFSAINIAILWIHSTGKQTLIKLLEHFKSQDKKATIYHIKGSAYYNPSLNKDPELENLTNKLDYREIFLGFKTENGNSRWLTDEEISSGVIYAIENDLKEYTVGITVPWELHP